MTDAVLVVADIAAGRFPTRCVRTGESTTMATHVWAVASPHADRVVALFGIFGVLALRATGRATMRVPIPVTAGPLGVWRRRALGWAAVTCFGIGTLAMSVRDTETSIAVVGVAVVVLSLLLRARAHSGFWVSAELRPAEAHVIVRRVSPAFDAEARALFLRQLKR